MIELQHNKHPLVFIADDDEDDVQFVRNALGEVDQEIEIRHFKNGIELMQGLIKANRHLPSIILLDLNMRVLDGRETLKMIRKNSGYDHLPIVMLSTSSQRDEKESCSQLGADKYFTKPWSYPMYLDIARQLKSEWLDHCEKPS